MIRLEQSDGNVVWVNKSQIAEFRGGGIRGTEWTEVRMIGQSFFLVVNVNPYTLATVFD